MDIEKLVQGAKFLSLTPGTGALRVKGFGNSIVPLRDSREKGYFFANQPRSNKRRQQNVHISNYRSGILLSLMKLSSLTEHKQLFKYIQFPQQII